jgi:KamA family protein
VEYIRSHREITNVLLTGGDPLILATSHLDEVLSKLRTIDHVKIVRIGSKMPAFAPSRITGDPSLLKMLRHHSTPEKRIYIMAHYNHPRELTAESRDAITALLASGSIVVNQTPLIRGVNDEASTLAELLDALSFIGVSPYYIFQCRPTVGNKPYSLPVEEGFRVFQEAQRKCSGLAARVRFVMSHTTGKIEVVGLSEDKIFMRYHRVPAVGALDRMFMFPRNPEAHWFDDYCSVPQPLPSKTSAT